MSRRGLLIALIVSLAVNLFVLGGLAGAALTGRLPHGKPPRDGPPPPPPLAAAGTTLPPPHREAWRSAMSQAAETSGPRIRQARELRREAWQALAAEQMDAQAALAQLDRSRALELQARSEMDRAVVGFASTLPPAERRELAQALSRIKRGGPEKGRELGRGPAADRERDLADR